MAYVNPAALYAIGSDPTYSPNQALRFMHMPRPMPIPANPKPTDEEKPILFKQDATEKPDKPVSTDSGAGTTAFRPMPYVRGALAFGNIAYPGQVGRAETLPHANVQPLPNSAPPAKQEAGTPNAIPNALGAQPKAIPMVPKQFKSIAGATPRKP